MNVEIGTEAAQFPFWEYFFPIFGTLYFAVQMELLMGKLRPIIKRAHDKILFKRDGDVAIFTRFSSNLRIMISVHALLQISSCYKQAGCM
jgi:hypothetical protein